LSSLNTRIEKVCWRLSARLNSAVDTDGEVGSVMDYIDLHTKLVDLANFHREYLRMQDKDEEIVYRAVCFMEEVLLTPFSGAATGPKWFYYNLHTLLALASGKGNMCNETKEFLNDLSRGIDEQAVDRRGTVDSSDPFSQAVRPQQVPHGSVCPDNSERDTARRKVVVQAVQHARACKIDRWRRRKVADDDPHAR